MRRIDALNLAFFALGYAVCHFIYMVFVLIWLFSKDEW